MTASRAYVRVLTFILLVACTASASAQSGTGPGPPPPSGFFADYPDYPPPYPWPRRWDRPIRGWDRWDYRRGADAYRDGYRDAWRRAYWDQRAERLRDAADRALHDGLTMFKAGDYGAATREFMLAAELDQGDAAARFYAALAMFALARYDEAAPLARRAVELNPMIPYLPLDVREEYGRADFGAHLDALHAAASAAANDADLWTLLGFYRRFSGDGSGAGEALSRARQLDPDDPLIARLAAVVE